NSRLSRGNARNARRWVSAGRALGPSRHLLLHRPALFTPRLGRRAGAQNDPRSEQFVTVLLISRRDGNDVIRAAGAAKRRENHPEHARFSANQSTTCAGSVSDGRSAATPEHGSAAAESCSPHQQELQIQDRRSQTWEWWTLMPRPRYAACRHAVDASHTRHILPARQSPASRTADMAPAHRRATSTVPARRAE